MRTLFQLVRMFVGLILSIAFVIIFTIFWPFNMMAKKQWHKATVKYTQRPSKWNKVKASAIYYLMLFLDTIQRLLGIVINLLLNIRDNKGKLFNFKSKNH